MLADLMQLAGIAAIIAAAFLFAIVAGLLVLGAALLVVGLALQDGTGLPWRS